MSDGLSEHAARNRAVWDRAADAYQAEHREHSGRPEPRVSTWLARQGASEEIWKARKLG